MPLEHEELTREIIGAAIEVHRTLGPGFIEAVYHRALEIELGNRRLNFDSELRAPIYYRGAEVGFHRIDLLIEGLVVVELKAVRAIEDIHFAIVRSYLRALNLEHALILNFARVSLEIRRGSARKHHLPGFLAS